MSQNSKPNHVKHTNVSRETSTKPFIDKKTKICYNKVTNMKGVNNEKIHILHIRVLTHMVNYNSILCNPINTYINIDMKGEPMRTVNKDGCYKVMYTKQVNGSYTTRVSVPNHMLKDIGVTPMERHIKFTRVENGILITKRD